MTALGAAAIERIPVPISELDRVLGGGLVPGSLVLIGGDPGIGKSTWCCRRRRRWPATGTGALRLGGGIGAADPAAGGSARSPLRRACSCSPGPISTRFWRARTRWRRRLLIVDSIQTVSVDEITSAAGSVSQVRECTARLMQWGKTRDVPVFIIGHVTKEGTIAGPRVLEHMVDAVLYLEGERHGQYRILRAVKNRFGSTDEVGVFEMAESGCARCAIHRRRFSKSGTSSATGSSVAVTVEGTRPILVEVQALTTPSAFGLPRRSANGLDAGRLQLLVAVLQKRVGLGLGGQDIYANVVGGMRIGEPAADLAVALAIASSFRDRPIDSRLVAIGEIGLSGELRSVSQIERRLGEAQPSWLRQGRHSGILGAARHNRCGGIEGDSRRHGCGSDRSGYLQRLAFGR